MSLLILQSNWAVACREEQHWIAQKLEQPHSITQQDQQQILEDLVVSDAFEQFLAHKFPKNKVSSLINV